MESGGSAASSSSGSGSKSGGGTRSSIAVAVAVAAAAAVVPVAMVVTKASMTPHDLVTYGKSLGPSNGASGLRRRSLRHLLGDRSTEITGLACKSQVQSSAWFLVSEVYLHASKTRTKPRQKTAYLGPEGEIQSQKLENQWWKQQTPQKQYHNKQRLNKWK